MMNYFFDTFNEKNKKKLENLKSISLNSKEKILNYY